MSKFGKDVRTLYEQLVDTFKLSAAPEMKVVEKVGKAKSVPEKSKLSYERVWREFETFTGKVGDDEPTEEDYVKFFSYLAEVRKYKFSSLYSYFVRLNTCHQTRYGFL